MRRSRSVGAATALCLLLCGIFAAAAWGIGELAQKDGTAGCISNDGTSGECVDGTTLGGPEQIAISPDGTSAYVTAFSDNAIVAFERDPGTGELTQKPGATGCIATAGAGGCTSGSGLSSAEGVAVSPDGANVYVTSYFVGAVSIFDRHPDTGLLTQHPGSSGCIGAEEFGGDPDCAPGNGLDGARSVQVSPDGRNVYVGSYTSSAVAIFDRDEETGALTQKPGAKGCITDNSDNEPPCADGKALSRTESIALSPDGKSLYAAANFSDAVSVFDRDAKTGELDQKPGTAGCVSNGGIGSCAPGSGLDAAQGVAVSADGNSVHVVGDGVSSFSRTNDGVISQTGCIAETDLGGACLDGHGLAGARRLAIAPDGANVYVAAGLPGDAVAILNRDAGGALTQDAGAAGCVSETGSGACADGKALFHPTSVAVSPDNGNVYVTAGPSGDSVAIFDRTAPPDTTSPSTTISGKPKSKVKTSKRKARVTVSFFSEYGARFECRLDSGAYEVCGSPFSAKASSKRKKGKRHSISVRATDPAGNVESPPAKVSFRVIRK